MVSISSYTTPITLQNLSSSSWTAPDGQQGSSAFSTPVTASSLGFGQGAGVYTAPAPVSSAFTQPLPIAFQSPVVQYTQPVQPISSAFTQPLGFSSMLRAEVPKASYVESPLFSSFTTNKNLPAPTMQGTPFARTFMPSAEVAQQRRDKFSDFLMISPTTKSYTPKAITPLYPTKSIVSSELLGNRMVDILSTPTPRGGVTGATSLWSNIIPTSSFTTGRTNLPTPTGFKDLLSARSDKPAVMPISVSDFWKGGTSELSKTMLDTSSFTTNKNLPVPSYKSFGEDISSFQKSTPPGIGMVTEPAKYVWEEAKGILPAYGEAGKSLISAPRTGWGWLTKPAEVMTFIGAGPLKVLGNVGSDIVGTGFGVSTVGMGAPEYSINPVTGERTYTAEKTRAELMRTSYLGDTASLLGFGGFGGTPEERAARVKEVRSANIPLESMRDKIGGKYSIITPAADLLSRFLTAGEIRRDSEAITKASAKTAAKRGEGLVNVQKGLDIEYTTKIQPLKAEAEMIAMAGGDPIRLSLINRQLEEYNVRSDKYNVDREKYVSESNIPSAFAEELRIAPATAILSRGSAAATEAYVMGKISAPAVERVAEFMGPTMTGWMGKNSFSKWLSTPKNQQRSALATLGLFTLGSVGGGVEQASTSAKEAGYTGWKRALITASGVPTGVAQVYSFMRGAKPANVDFGFDIVKTTSRKSMPLGKPSSKYSFTADTGQPISTYNLRFDWPYSPAGGKTLAGISFEGGKYVEPTLFKSSSPTYTKGASINVMTPKEGATVSDILVSRELARKSGDKNAVKVFDKLITVSKEVANLQYGKALKKGEQPAAQEAFVKGFNKFEPTMQDAIKTLESGFSKSTLSFWDALRGKGILYGLGSSANAEVMRRLAGDIDTVGRGSAFNPRNAQRLLKTSVEVLKTSIKDTPVAGRYKFSTNQATGKIDVIDRVSGATVSLNIPGATPESSTRSVFGGQTTFERSAFGGEPRVIQSAGSELRAKFNRLYQGIKIGPDGKAIWTSDPTLTSGKSAKQARDAYNLLKEAKKQNLISSKTVNDIKANMEQNNPGLDLTKDTYNGQRIATPINLEKPSFISSPTTIAPVSIYSSVRQTTITPGTTIAGILSRPTKTTTTTTTTTTKPSSTTTKSTTIPSITTPTTPTTSTSSTFSTRSSTPSTSITSITTSSSSSSSAGGLAQFIGGGAAWPSLGALGGGEGGGGRQGTMIRGVRENPIRNFFFEKILPERLGGPRMVASKGKVKAGKVQNSLSIKMTKILGSEVGVKNRIIHNTTPFNKHDTRWRVG